MISIYQKNCNTTLKLHKYIKAENYLIKAKLLKKKLNIRRLEQIKLKPAEITIIWRTDKIDPCSEFDTTPIYYIFGFPIDLNNIHWHRDIMSGYSYPVKRSDKLIPGELFNKGIDVVFPWEQSRFYFAINLSQKYLISKDEIYYNLFKKLFYDWKSNNAFLYGINWLSTMDVSIRAANLLIAANLFGMRFINDSGFRADLSYVLLQHSEYISSFPAVYSNGLLTNHTISAYCGLFLLGLSFPEYPKSKNWLKQSIAGLETCMREQVYNDGVDFEGSIPYHRLVLELFAYTTIAALANSIFFSDSFFIKLFKMFEFTAAYLDHKGNAPQIGDNDSGRFLIFNSLAQNNPYLNNDHSYLLSLGEYIFNSKFACLADNNSDLVTRYFPAIRKISVEKLNINIRNTHKSVSFRNGGAYFLKNEFISLLVSCFPLGQNGKGGHNHFDAGSFTLSFNGMQIIVDPGSPTYTRNKTIRDKFRSYEYHNTLFTSLDKKLDWKKLNYWDLTNEYSCEVINFSDTEISLIIKLQSDPNKRFRNFSIGNNVLKVYDTYQGQFYQRINLTPDEVILHSYKNAIKTKNILISFSERTNYEIVDYDYSPHYGKIENSKAIIFSSTGSSSINITGLS